MKQILRRGSPGGLARWGGKLVESTRTSAALKTLASNKGDSSGSSVANFTCLLFFKLW